MGVRFHQGADIPSLFVKAHLRTRVSRAAPSEFSSLAILAAGFDASYFLRRSFRGNAKFFIGKEQGSPSPVAPEGRERRGEGLRAVFVAPGGRDQVQFMKFKGQFQTSAEGRAVRPSDA